MTEPAASLPNFKRFKVTNLQWATLIQCVTLILSTKPTVTQRWHGTIRQSGKLVRELCSTFTMYAEKMIYILESGINNGYSYAPYVNLLLCVEALFSTDTRPARGNTRTKLGNMDRCLGLMLAQIFSLALTCD